MKKADNFAADGGSMHASIYTTDDAARALLSKKKLFIFDLDGTVYLGGIPFDFAVRYIEALRANGRRVLFFTNNASHTDKFYLQKLTNLGFSPAPGEIMTAGDVTAEFLLRHRGGKSVYLLGTSELRADWEARGVRLVSDEDVSADARVDIVVSSFDTELTYEKLEHAVRLILRGAEYICTHPDKVCPTEDSFIPDSGAIAAAITSATGKTPRFFGKPGRETMEMIREVTIARAEDIVVFGDRMYTDIALGKKNGITSCLVLTGETTADDLRTTPVDAMPDIVLPSLKEAHALTF